MGRTNDLRKLVRSTIAQATTGLSGIYYERADAKALYPHVTFEINRVDLQDLNRHDYRVVVDVWCRGNSAADAEAYADAIEDAFNALNAPQATILPTFFLETRRTVLDEDKLIRHKQIELIAQNYEVQING